MLEVKKKALNVITFNVPESCNSPSVYTIENAKKDLNLFQDRQGTETELNTLYHVGKYNSSKTRPVILKLRSQSTRKRLLSLRNLKTFHHGKEINIYINVDRTEMEHFRKLKS